MRGEAGRTSPRALPGGGVSEAGGKGQRAAGGRGAPQATVSPGVAVRGLCPRRCL